MCPPPDNTPGDTWTDGGPTSGGPQDKSFAYRQSRKAFIEACEKAGADVVGRVHPARGPDDKPLFLDAAAFGPRLAKAGVLVVAYGAGGAAILQALLSGGAAAHLPQGVRLVLVHGADPAAFSFNDPAREDAGWGAAMLASVVTEDLRHARRLTVIGLGGPAAFDAPAATTVKRLQPPVGGAARAFVAAAIAAAG
jgi:hypothetical protein